MADFFDGSYRGTSRSELELLIRRLVSDGTEGPVEKRLADFDANAPRSVEGGFRRGFIDGAVSAWVGQSSSKS